MRWLLSSFIIFIAMNTISCTRTTSITSASLFDVMELISDYQEIEYDVVLIAGQSNAFGIGSGDGDLYVPNDRISMLNEDYSITIANERIIDDVSYNNFGLFFAKEYVEEGLLVEGRQLLLVNVAVGGTGFADHRWSKGEDLYEHMILVAEAFQSLNPDNEIVTILWHQGETDALLNATYREYYANFHALVTNVRCDLSLPDVSFIAGDMVPAWKEESKNRYPIDEVAAASKQVMMDLPNCGYVETDGLTSNVGDIIHFSRAANIELGNRYFLMYTLLL